VGTLALAQLSTLVGKHVLGLAGVGAIVLATTISIYAQQVDNVVTQTVYPAICAVKDRTELLLETFVKSNRLALMWGMPFGVGLALFAADLVHFVIGDKWELAIGLLEVFGLISAVNHIGFNWTAFFRAKGDTRPLAVSMAVGLVLFCGAALPLLIADGLNGFAIGMSVMTVGMVVVRFLYLKRLFPGFGALFHIVRAIAPTVPAVAVVLGMRLLETGERTAGIAIAELAVYVLVTVLATLLFERDLLREMAGYVRRRTAAAPAT
jgi:O-antigen/teichoic acid export membrane protein